MERILKIVIDLLKGATYDLETKFTQADSQSHYLQIDFSDTSLNFSGVSMKVNFIRSDGVAVTTSKASVTSSNKVQIPTNALAKFGELGIEIILIKGDSILTVNKLIRVTVIKTLAGEGIDLEIGDSFLNEINQLTVNLSKVLTGEGDKQIERVRATGNEVVKQVESILGNNPEGGNAAAVGGLSRAGIETLIDNVVGKVEDGKFPLTSAEVGKVYEAVNGKKYKCITAYSGSSLSTPNANFIEMSLNNHADRLDNLKEYQYYLKIELSNGPNEKEKGNVCIIPFYSYSSSNEKSINSAITIMFRQHFHYGNYTGIFGVALAPYLRYKNDSKKSESYGPKPSLMYSSRFSETIGKFGIKILIGEESHKPEIHVAWKGDSTFFRTTFSCNDRITFEEPRYETQDINDDESFVWM